MMEYQRAVRNRQIERARRLLDQKDPEEIKKGPNDVKRFLKRATQTESGEKVSVKYTLDEAKIAEEERYDGYYAVATNLLDPAKDILKISHKRYQIEDCFRMMKKEFYRKTGKSQAAGADQGTFPDLLYCVAGVPSPGSQTG